MNTPSSSLNYKQKGQSCHHGNSNFMLMSQVLVKAPDHLHSTSRIIIGDKYHNNSAVYYFYTCSISFYKQYVIIYFCTENYNTKNFTIMVFSDVWLVGGWGLLCSSSCTKIRGVQCKSGFV